MGTKFDIGITLEYIGDNLTFFFGGKAEKNII